MKSYFKSLWRAVTGKSQIRSYRDTVGLGEDYRDWVMSFISEDADLRNNLPAMRERSRSLAKENCYFRKYKEELFANVLGEEGIRLRMKVKEESDRVVYAADEKAMMEADDIRRECLRGRAIKSGFGEILFRPRYDRAKATIKAGAIDLYACRLIEEGFKEWKRAEFCTMAANMSFNGACQTAVWSCARDGEIFIRLIEVDPEANKFGFSLQLINAEWCDVNLNVAQLPNGNSIRMGIELDQWGKKVAYHFIKRQPGDWEHSTAGIGYSAGSHQRIEAREIIHYVRLEHADSTRGAPWCASVFKKMRQLDGFEEAEVIAARTAACKMGFLESTIHPEGGEFEIPDPCKKPASWNTVPGGVQGLKHGVTFKEWNPNHPTQNFDAFRRGMLRSACAGMVGADYNVMASDLENINFSAGRLGRLDTNEMWKLLQRFHIDIMERPIFERFVERAIAVGAIKLPLAKLKKYQNAHFSGRRWAGVDPIKETQAAVLAIQNRLTSYSRWYDENGMDLEEVWTEIAEEEMLAEELGIKLPGQLEAELAMAAAESANQEDEDGEEKPKKKPVKKSNGRQVSLKIEN